MIQSAMAALVIPNLEVMYLNGIRYYSDRGVAQHKPRGRFCRFEVDGESGAFVFIRGGAAPLVINMTSEIFGWNDIWYSSEQELTRAKWQGTTMYAFPVARKVNASEWYHKLMNNSLILDGKLVIGSRGTREPKQGRSVAPAKVTKKYMSMEPGMRSELAQMGVNLDDPNVRRDFITFEVEFTNMVSMWKTNHLDQTDDPDARDYDEKYLFTTGPKYPMMTLSAKQDLWVAGHDLVFTEEADAIEASKAGIIGVVPVAQPVGESFDARLNDLLNDHFDPEEAQRMADIWKRMTDGSIR